MAGWSNLYGLNCENVNSLVVLLTRIICQASKLALCAQHRQGLTVHVLASYHDYRLGLMFIHFTLQCNVIVILSCMYPVNWMRL